MSLTKITLELRREMEKLSFAEPVTHVYNPLRYAWKTHKEYLERFGQGTKEALFVGMNPGPWGMAQTGVPFGEVALVRDWMGISGKVNKPASEHPKRPVTGFDCARSEVSGKRVWGWAQDRFGAPEAFFDRFFVWNYCPLSFMEEGGRNRTPDKLDREERRRLFAACDISLTKVIKALQPDRVFGIGGFAARRCAECTESVPIFTAPHPSPASPLANRGWAPIFEKALKEAGVKLPRKAR